MENSIISIINVFFLVISIFVIKKINNIEKLIINYKFWIFISWEFSLLLYSFSGIVYPINLDLKVYLYILAFWSFFLFGTKIAKNVSARNRINEKKTNDEIKNIEYKRLNMRPIFIISLISTVLYIIAVNRLNPNVTMGITRGVKTNSLTTLFLLISSGSLIVWLYELLYSIRNQKKIKLYGLISAVLYNIPGIVISGRDALMIFMISTIIVVIYSLLYLKRKKLLTSKIKRKIKFFTTLSVFLIILYLLLISSIRYGRNDNSVLTMFEWASGATFPSYLVNLYMKIGAFGKLILNIVFYYSSQFSKLTLVVKHFNGPYQFGMYQLHYIARLMPSFMGIDTDAVSKVLKPICDSYNLPGIKTLWGTMIEYSIYDFGKIGALIYSFIFGFIISKIVNKNMNQINKEVKQNELNIITIILVCVGMFTTVEISPLFDYFYVFPALWLIIIKVLYKRFNGSN